MIRNRSTLGFSLVELLIVLAIIGILAGLILTGISLSRDRSEDVRVKSGIRQLRILAENFFDSNSLSYATYDTCVESPGPLTCLSQSTSDKVVTLIADIEGANGSVGSVDASAATDKFCITAPLKSNPSAYICIDGSGNLYEDVSTSSPCGGNSPVLTCTYN